jgi:hypothetical protein
MQSPNIIFFLEEIVFETPEKHKSGTCLCSICFGKWIALSSVSDVDRFVRVRAAAHQLRQDKHQDMRQKTQFYFIRDSDSGPHTEVARVCVLSYLLKLMT